jgi:hypothetical protein
MPRKKKSKRRRDNSIRLLNVLEAYTYATILSEGITGSSPWGFVTGDFDLVEMTVTKPFTGEETSWGGTDAISLRDVAREPGQALAVMSSNFNSNLTNMALQGIFTGVSFKLGRRLLRRPIANINRNIAKPLGLGVKL